ncbi:MAG: sugar ABC transporter permease [Lentisphaeraceae bacterium]|nr:sugar ABC transporter permease [Lentisphaeraceae bacterium]
MKGTHKHIRSGRDLWYLSVPFIFFLIIFWIVPLLEGFRMSFDPQHPAQATSAFANYKTLFSDGLFSKAIKNTAVYTASCLGIIIPLSLCMAYLFSQMINKVKYTSSFILLLPGLFPPIVLAILFMNVFHGRTGLLNQVFIMPFGGKPVNWMSHPDYILSAMVIQSVWRWTGFITLFLLCGLESIPKSVKEAATIDGASKFQIFKSIEIPGIKHLIIFCAAFLFIDTFSLFAGSFTLLGPSGGTANAGLLMVNYAYKFTRFQEYNLASTVCVSMLPILMVLTGLFCLRRRKQA